MNSLHFSKILTALSAIVVAVFLYYGVTADDLTSLDAVIALLKDTASNPAVLISAVSAVIASLSKFKRNGDDKNAG